MRNSNSKPHENTKSGIIKSAKFRFTALFVFIALASTAVFSSTASAGSLSAFIFGSQLAEGSAASGASFFKPADFFSTKPAPVAVVEEAGGQNDEIATITTDRTDYKPGETVVITGAGFTVYEPITLKIDREGVEAATLQATADENGNFINRQFVIGADDLGASFVVKATGATSGKTAQSKFTDGTITYSPGSQYFTGGSAVTSGAAAVTVNFQQTVILPSGCPTAFTTVAAKVANTTNFGGNPTTPFPSGFTVSTSPTGGRTFPIGGTQETYNVRIQVPANTTPGFYSAEIIASNAGCHTAGIGTQVIVEVKAPAPADATAPTTIATSGTYISNTWTKDNVTVNLNSTDNVGGVGMQSLTYTVTKPNNVSATTNVTVAPFSASINVTDEGLTTIQYFARDTLNNTEATQTFYVNIDKTAPTLALPNNITVQADDATGKVVNYNATATDRAPASQPATCTPASGTLFAIGTTPVNCSATDDVGNVSTGGFSVEVTKAAQSINFGALAGKTYGDADFAVSAPANSGLAVSFAASGNCTVTGNTVHITGAGNCTITASQAGDANYLAATSVPQSFNIAKAIANCSSITGYNAAYDAQPHGATGSCTGVDAGGAATGGTLNLGAQFTNVPGGTANWSFTGGANYTDQSGSVSIAIGKADATCTINGFTGPYDGTAHGATGSCKGVQNETLTGLNLGSSFTNVPGGTAHWTFTDVTGNYNDDSDDVSINISKANASIVVTPYNVVYDGAAHTATGTATGAGGENLNSLLTLSGTTHTNAGTYNNDAWSFAGDSNHNASNGTVNDVITKADAICTVNGYTGVYDAAAHGATGSCKGVQNETLTGLNLGSSFTNAPGGTANWTYTDSTGNYKNANGSVSISISKANATIVVTPYSVLFDGNPHTATGTATGVDGSDLSSLLNLSGTTHTLAGSYPNDPWTFAGNTNYNSASGAVSDTIGYWSLSGFYQPVDMNGVVNTVKNGSTVPLKFEIFKGTTESSNVADVKSLYAAEVSCSGLSTIQDDIEVIATGNTVLRYDATSGQFIYNWKTPNTVGKCYRVTMTTQDLSTISAFFKLK